MRILRISFRKIVWCFLISFCHSFLYGTTLRELTLKEMCSASTDIIMCHVQSIEYYWNADMNRIFSEIELEVENKLQGQFQTGDRFKVFLLGGSIDEITMFVVGGPEFIVGEKSLLFLREKQLARSETNFIVVGLSQGKFDIYINSETGEENVIRDQIDFSLQTEADGAVLPISDSKSISLNKLISFVNKYTP